MLLAAGRHAWRPAHIHFIIAVEGYKSVTAHLFVAGSEFLDSDVVQAVKQSLIVEFVSYEDTEEGRSSVFEGRITLHVVRGTIIPT